MNWWTDRNESYFTPREGDIEDLEWVDVELVDEAQPVAEVSDEDTVPGFGPDFFEEKTRKVQATKLVYLAVLEDARVTGDRVLEKLAVMAMDGSLSAQDYVKMVFAQDRAQA